MLVCTKKLQPRSPKQIANRVRFRCGSTLITWQNSRSLVKPTRLLTKKRKNVRLAVFHTAFRKRGHIFSGRNHGPFVSVASTTPTSQNYFKAARAIYQPSLMLAAHSLPAHGKLRITSSKHPAVPITSCVLYTGSHFASLALSMYFKSTHICVIYLVSQGRAHDRREPTSDAAGCRASRRPPRP